MNRVPAAHCLVWLLVAGCGGKSVPIPAPSIDAAGYDGQLTAPADAVETTPTPDVAVDSGAVDAGAAALAVDAMPDSLQTTMDMEEQTDCFPDFDDVGMGNAAEVAASPPDAPACSGSVAPATPSWPPISVVNGCAVPLASASMACAATACAADQACVGAGLCLPAKTGELLGAGPSAGAAAMAIGAGGAWAVVYSSGDSSSHHVYLSVGTLAKLQVGVPLQVNDIDGSLHGVPAVVALADGSWLVLWVRYSQAVNQSKSLHARRIAADGSAAMGPAWQLNTTVLGDGAYSPGGFDGPVAERTQDGHVLVTWAGALPATAPWGVYGRLLAEDGTAAGPEFPIAGASATANAGRPSLARLASDRIVAAWPQMAGGKNMATRVYVRQITDGAVVSLGPAVQVSPGLLKIESLPAIAAYGADQILVAWQSNPGSSAFQPAEVYAQTWNWCGQPAASGTAQHIGSNPSGVMPVNAQAVAMAGGRVVVLWQVFSTPDKDEVRARRFNATAGVWDCEVENLAGPVLAPETGWRSWPFAVALPGGGFLATWNAGVSPPPTSVIKLGAWAW